MFNLKDLIVDKFSLVSKGKKPAVMQAETKFSIFKIAEEKKPAYIEKLEEISKAYKKETLFVSRPVKNAKEIIKWAESEGITDVISANDMHVTTAFSTKKVSWWQFKPNADEITIDLESAKVVKLWDAIVIKFKSPELQNDWKQYMDGGASWDYDAYQPHISLSYTIQDIKNIGRYTGKLTLWGEVMDEVKAELIKKLERISKAYSA